MTMRTDEVRTAAELIDRLTGPQLSQPGRYLFRGHSSSTFELVPKILRKHAPFPFTPDPRRTVGEQLTLEAQVLIHFFDAVYQQGLPLPDTFESLNVTMNHIRTQLQYSIPIQFATLKGARHVLALAQHYGSPTRLIDWTYSPLIAAYFAAADPSCLEALDGSLAVVIFDGKMLSKSRWGAELQEVLELLRLPYDINRNARGQQAAFLMDLRPQNLDEPSRAMSLDEISAEGVSFSSLLLPRKQVAPLLNLLRSRGITGASVFDGYHGSHLAEREATFLGLRMVPQPPTK